MLRVVVDTNVWVSALINPKGIPGQVLESYLEGRWEFLISAEILEEYERVLFRKKFGFSRHTVKETIDRLRQAAIFVYPTETINVCSDPEDDKFIICALSGKATHLITGNLKHFPKSPFLDTTILSPTAFLKLF